MNTNYNEIDKNNYNEYIEKILNIYRLSSKDSSILFNIKIENYKCYCSMSIVGRAGDKQEFSDVILDFDDKFFPEFLDVLVTRINNDVRIKVKNKKIKVLKEDSPLHLCSKQGYISKSYESIICLPNKIVIKLENNSDIDVIAG